MNPSRSLDVFRLAVVGTVAVLLICQLFVPPIIGLADQGDFARMIGRFGYGPEDKSSEYKVAFVVRTYVRDPGFRIRPSEQVNSEYLFVGPAVLLTRLFSTGDKLDIRLIGVIHMLAFLAAFMRLLAVTKKLKAAPFVWLAAALVLTDVGYVAYWNSFYAEAASCIFFLLLLTESLVMCQAPPVSNWQVVRWSLWAALLVIAKAQNAPLGFLLVLVPLRLHFWEKVRPAWGVVIGGCLMIGLATAVTFMTNPVPSQWANTYNELFLGILPESSNPTADLKALGLGPEYVKYSGTGAWSPGTAFPEMVMGGIIGKRITPGSIARFYALHPGRVWRRAKAVLPIAFSLRPEWCGNFERSAGRPPGAKSTAFSLWSGFREKYLARAGKLVLLAMLVCPALLVGAWIRLPAHRRWIESLGLVNVCGIAAFVVAVCGEAWDNVKHLFLFNLLLDTWLVTLLAAAVTMGRSTVRRRRE